MPLSRKATGNRPQSSILSSQQQFEFPTNSHLLITTPRNVFAWDSKGLHSIFNSRRGGIVAAREAKDGSGVLAVASSNVVVMHDTQRGQEESWGLDAPIFGPIDVHDRVRHLEYAPDAKSLFLSTTSDGTIQHYSTEASKMLDPTQKHNVAPAALAISPTGHLVLSASHHPPVIFLKNLDHNSSPVHVQPNASSASVSCASFHPERPNVYLLAFRDGTVAAYDATRISRNGSAADGEISCLRSLHRAIATGDESFDKSCLAAPVAGAAFLPGYKTRAVTAGRDGKCKLIDFARGGVILRTWHAKAPLTSVSVLPLRSSDAKQESGKAARESMRKRTSASHIIGGPTSTDCIIVVSRVDGQVHLYDGVGNLQAQKTITAQEERILSVEWATGPAPNAVTHTLQKNRRFSETPSVTIAPDAARMGSSSGTRSSTKGKTPYRQSRTRTQLGLPADLRRSSNTSPRKFTLHPDEVDVDSATVRYTPSPTRTQPMPLAGAGYQDLFSPVNAVEPMERIASPSRNRPRLSSQTFVKSPEAEGKGKSPVSPSRNLAAIPFPGTTSSTTQKERLHPARAPTLKAPRQATVHVSPLTKTRRRQIKFKHGGDACTRSQDNTSLATMNSNAKLLADLRKLAADGPSQRKHGTLSSYAASQRRVSGPNTRTVHTPEQGLQSALVHHLDTHAVDSSSATMDDAEEDIWLTSASESEFKHGSRRRRKPVAGGLAKHTTLRTTVVPEAQTQNSEAINQMDGSTEEENFATAASRLSPNKAAFSPVSKDVRELFPRTSSLSPRHRQSPRRSARQRFPLKEASLTSMAVNGAFGRQQSRSPWARAKAEKGAKTLQVLEDPPSFVSEGLQRSEGLACLSCPETKSRVQALEGEVAHLKGEVLALKAVLRRNGLSVPAVLR